MIDNHNMTCWDTMASVTIAKVANISAKHDEIAILYLLIAYKSVE